MLSGVASRRGWVTQARRWMQSSSSATTPYRIALDAAVASVFAEPVRTRVDRAPSPGHGLRKLRVAEKVVARVGPGVVAPKRERVRRGEGPHDEVVEVQSGHADGVRRVQEGHLRCGARERERVTA